MLFPWYLIWGLPYALLDRRNAFAFLLTIPLVAFSFATTYSDTVFIHPILVAMPTIGVLLRYLSIRGTRVLAL
ncbi:MAG: hypothetical protein NVS2B3_05350 [Vulcanimicrobiaceae bacterium]